MSDTSNTDALEDRLTQVLYLITDQPEAAKHGLLVTTRQAGITVTDLRVVVAQNDRQSAMFTLVNENRALREQVTRWRGAKGLTWSEFAKACGEHIDTESTKWRSVIAKHLGLTAGDLTAWERADRVPVAVLKQLEKVPDLRDSVDTKKKTNFQTVMGHIVDHLKLAGVAPKQIAEWLTVALNTYDGDEIGINHILGRRTVVPAEEIRPPEDVTPVQLKEVTAMATSLWGRDSHKRPMENFILAHTQVDVFGCFQKPHLLAKLEVEHRRKLRLAVERENELRKTHPRYERFSRAFANLPKRTRKQRAPKDVGTTITGKTVQALGERWFGADYQKCLAALLGWNAGTYLPEIVNGGRDVPGEMETVLLGMQRCLDGIDLDAPDFVDTVFRRVKDHVRLSNGRPAEPDIVD